MTSSDKVKVAVRVRPFSRREVDLGTKCVVDMDGTQTILFHPSTGIKESDVVQTTQKTPKSFAFDNCFWSMDENNPKFVGQKKVFSCLGQDILERAFEGYNACIFAYGQTGSGKSYSMMGTSEQKGIIPRLCDSLFERIAATTDMELNHKVEVSYMEIYNEKVRDLLDPSGKHNLRVREHNILGPYVDGLSTLAVSSFEDIDNLMCEGNKSRTVAATNMNSESSRSHAVFNIILTQTLTDQQSGVSGEKVSKLSLVDLAGSERAQKTGAVGERLKEGSNINKSLTTLGLVISALADHTAGKNKNKFIPYRDSVLTWLLKDNLGGNSKTVMIATLSPAADNYEETLSTLRYADRAKRIVNHAVVNEDPNARIIRELREEVDMLKKMLNEAQSFRSDDLHERLEESEKLMTEMSKTWEEKMRETESKHQERHAALEKMGISVQMSGIKVEQGKYYLVNLNADPSLNELLVYYLKDYTRVGRQDAVTEQDIQLSGLGIMPEHCVVLVENHEVYIQPIENARTCVNGRSITEMTRVKHGDRLLWGNNHFFRINCPKSANSPSSETPDNIDYEYAQQELMNAQMGNDPVQEAISAIEAQHEEEKQEALDKQRLMYERQMQMLRSQLMSPSTPSLPYIPFFDPLKMSSSSVGGAQIQSRYQQWAQEKDKMFRQSLARLKEEVIKANALVREANSLALEMGKQVEFSVTLQIPAANLSPNRKRGTFVSEPAILVKHKGRSNIVWSMEKFENKIVDMRDMYEDQRERMLPMMDDSIPHRSDPFYESQENHNLIGVANVFLEALFYDVKLDYQVPIISQQGEVAGRLHIELSRVPVFFHDQKSEDVMDEEEDKSILFSDLEKANAVAVGSSISCRVSIKEARGLPPALSNFVFCQYTFWGEPERIMVPPVIDPECERCPQIQECVQYNHEREFLINVSEEFLEHCTEGSLSIEVWGNRSPGFSSDLSGWQLEQVTAKSLSIMDRWIELTRKLQLSVEIHELNEQGEYVPVEILSKTDVLTGGVFQLRQGHSRRILVQVLTVQNSGTLPIICESVNHVSIGCVCARSKLQKGLDSYQEEDLNLLRSKWTEALDKRRTYLDEQLQKIMNKNESEKTEADSEREKSLLDQWVALTEERNAVLVPLAGSFIPGAPADWDPLPGMEQHIPVIFLDLNAEDMSTPNIKEGIQAAGVNSILPKEHGANFYNLPFVKSWDKQVCALVSWDSSIHDSPHLNRVTQNNERVYLILKAVVRLSHPASMELVLRKRICINVYKRQSITDKLKKRISRVDSLHTCSITYEIVSNIPKASEDLEDRESLAQMAASQNEQNTSDGETYIEKYIRGLSAVDCILTLDKLRQEVSIKEIMASSGHNMRRAASVPNIQNLRSDSYQELSYRKEIDGPCTKSLTMDVLQQHVSSDNSKDNVSTPSKPAFSLSPLKSGVTPQPGLTPLTTLLEEQSLRETKPLLHTGYESDEEDLVNQRSDLMTLNEPSGDGTESDEFQEFQKYDSSGTNIQIRDADECGSEHNVHVTKEYQKDIMKNISSLSNKISEHQSQNILDCKTNIDVGAFDIFEIGTAGSHPNRSQKSSTENVETSGTGIVKNTDFAQNKVNNSFVNGKDPLQNPNIINHSADVIGHEIPSGMVSSIPQNPTSLSYYPTVTEECSQKSNVTYSIAVIQSIDNFTKSSVPAPEPNLHHCEKEDSIQSKAFDNIGGLHKSSMVEETQQCQAKLSALPVETDLKSSDDIESTQVCGVILNQTVTDLNTVVVPRDIQVVSSTADVKLRKRRNNPGRIVYRRSWTDNLDNNPLTKSIPEDGIPMEIHNSTDKNTDSTVNSSKHKDRSEITPGKGTADLGKSICRPVSMPTVLFDSGPDSFIKEKATSDVEDDGMSVCSFGSRADLNQLGESPIPSWIQLGEPVLVLSTQGATKSGVVQFFGATDFAHGNWVGVELCTPDGKNDGSVKGVRYFKCRSHHGVFVRHDKIIMDKKRKLHKNRTSSRQSTGSVTGTMSNVSTIVGNPHHLKEKSKSSFMKPTTASSAKHK